MKTIILLFALATPGLAQTLDVNQPSSTGCLSGTWQDDLAQSFKPTTTNCSGAGFFMDPSVSGYDDIEIKLYSALPNQGGVVLASGVGTAYAGQWLDVFWPPIPVTPGQSYYLVVGANWGALCLAGSINNPYPDGICYANSPFNPWPNFDYTFRTWTQDRPILSVSGGCPQVTISVDFATPSAQLALVSSATQGYFLIPGGACAGTSLGLSNPVLRTIQFADAAGQLNLNVNLPAGACGVTWIQTVDLSTCRASNVAGL